MTRTNNTPWIAGAGVLALLAVVATYFLLIAPKRAEAADIAEQRASVAQSNAAIEQKTAQLKSQFGSLGEKKAQIAAITSTMPADADVPALIDQLSGYADSSGVSLTGLTPGTPEVFGAASGGEAAPAAGLTAVDIPLSITVKGAFPQIELYLKNVQADMGRYFLVENVTLQSGDAGAGSNLTGTIAGKIFVLRDGAAATTGTSATVPTTTTTDANVASSSTKTVS